MENDLGNIENFYYILIITTANIEISGVERKFICFLKSNLFQTPKTVFVQKVGSIVYELAFIKIFVMKLVIGQRHMLTACFDQARKAVSPWWLLFFLSICTTSF